MSKGKVFGRQNQFSSVGQPPIARSAFDRSAGTTTAFQAGKIIPIFCDEIYPGDTMNMRIGTKIRMTTQLVPLMSNIYVDLHFFAVPIRLIWSDWAKFNGEQEDPDSSIDFLVPEIVSTASTGYQVESVHDYLGFPIGVPDLTHSALWHRGHNLIYNEWFRAQDLQDSVPKNTGPGPDDPDDYGIYPRGKRHDYFTSCQPWPLKGGVDVVLPLGSIAPVIPDPVDSQPNFDVNGSIRAIGIIATGQSVDWFPNAPHPGADSAVEWNQTGLVADLASATASTIADIREAFVLQQLLETDARGGTRYIERVKNHFGVSSPDARLQRPEFLGGGSIKMGSTSVPSSMEFGTRPIGDLGAYSEAQSNHIGFTKSFTEHCIVIGYASARADLTYQQGLNRMFSRSTREDFYLPALANLSEQEVLNKEIMAEGSLNGGTSDAMVFGYQERWAEMRYKPSQITGKMRSTAPTPLDIWHLAQEFDTVPVLGAAFIEEDPPLERITAVDDEPHFYFDAWFLYKHVRAMPVHSIPGMGGRF